ncbi:hypothetical protein F5Y16DRAFT_316920 [Xylariaceae sp. FL0255]|nr:hypothetical protein F5Y16DRAFT_316920 [Xylariaceae sp. FL0255]
MFFSMMTTVFVTSASIIREIVACVIKQEPLSTTTFHPCLYLHSPNVGVEPILRFRGPNRERTQRAWFLQPLLSELQARTHTSVPFSEKKRWKSLKAKCLRNQKEPFLSFVWVYPSCL